MKFFKSTFIVFIFLFSISFVKGQSSLVDSFLHSDSIRHLVEVLSSDSLKGRFSGTAENLNAALFIANEFEKAGLNPVAGNNGFFMQIKPSWFNVVGAIKGKSKPGQVIIFSAHYDHVGTIKTNPYPDAGGKGTVEKGDEIFNGANDNASGVAAIICLANYFKNQNNNERTLVFVAFTGEELGLIGSQNLADNCNPDSIIAVINIEMIGRSTSTKPRPYITGYEHSDLIKILNRNYRFFGDKSEKAFFKNDPYPKSFLFIRSDNYPFARKGIPAHSIMVTSPNDEYYHNLNDEAGTLNYELMKKMIQAIANGVVGLVTGVDTPKRIKGV